MNMFSVGKITKYWLILFKIEVKKNYFICSNDWKKVNKWAHFEKFFSVKENISALIFIDKR